MFEDLTYLDILEEMVNFSRDDVDKSEGSLVWESFSATANEFILAYRALNGIVNNAYLTTADRNSLLKHGETYGLVPYAPTGAVVQAEFICNEGVNVAIGSRFTCDTIFYRVITKVDSTKYNLECETPGTIGNRSYGQLLPVFGLPGFKSAKIIKLLIPGEDEEETEAFRNRIKQAIGGEAFGGNLLDYIEKVGSIAGVGDCKIIRCPRGEGSVDVYIVDSQFKPATEELVSNVQKTLRPLDIDDIDNCGLGIVPIGHDTIVKSATSVDITINFKLTYESEHNFESVKPAIEEAIGNYIKDLSKSWGDTNNYKDVIKTDYHNRFITIQINKIGSLLFDIEGVHDYEAGSIKINGNAKDLSLAFNEVPVLSEVIDG